jgi:hypothetical protein
MVYHWTRVQLDLTFKQLNIKPKTYTVQGRRKELSNYIKQRKAKEDVEKVSVTGEIMVVSLQFADAGTIGRIELSLSSKTS